MKEKHATEREQLNLSLADHKHAYKKLQSEYAYIVLNYECTVAKNDTCYDKRAKKQLKDMDVMAREVRHLEHTVVSMKADYVDRERRYHADVVVIRESHDKNKGELSQARAQVAELEEVNDDLKQRMHEQEVHEKEQSESRQVLTEDLQHLRLDLKESETKVIEVMELSGRKFSENADLSELLLNNAQKEFCVDMQMHAACTETLKQAVLRVISAVGALDDLHMLSP